MLDLLFPRRPAGQPGARPRSWYEPGDATGHDPAEATWRSLTSPEPKEARADERKAKTASVCRPAAPPLGRVISKKDPRTPGPRGLELPRIPVATAAAATT